MKRIAFLLFAVVAVAGVVVHIAHASGHADGEAAPLFGIKIPRGYRDWRLVSVAHEEGDLNDIRAILGNDTAIKAYREGKLPFPDGTIIARIAWSYVPSGKTTKSLAVPNLSFPGPPRIGTFSLWSRTQKSTPRQEAGGSLSSIRTATLRRTRRS